MKVLKTSIITLLILSVLIWGLIEINYLENKKFKKELMEKRKRPCEVNTKKWISSTESPSGKSFNQDVKFKGLFHEWGNEAVENSGDGFGNFTIAIVEDESGQVHTVNPNHVKFLDK